MFTIAIVVTVKTLKLFPRDLTLWEYLLVEIKSTNEPLSYIVKKSKKGKVVPVLPLTEYRAMKAYWGSGGT
jgi:hypothetical protein